MTSLSDRLKQKKLLVAPGCYDALSALMIERAPLIASRRAVSTCFR